MRLESEFDAVTRLTPLVDRPNMRARYATFYRGAAASVAPWFAADDMLMSASLVRLGLLPPVEASNVVLIDSQAEALGLVYVVEGSALGGRMILRALEDRGVPVNGLQFLHPHGDGAGMHWRAVLERLESELGGADDLVERAVAGARRGFAFARQCFCEPLPCRHSAEVLEPA